MKTSARLLLAGIVAALVCPNGNAQQIIYSNSFTGGQTTINGTAPTIVSNIAGGSSSATWKFTYTNAQDGGWLANGALGTNAGSAVMPFKAQSGAVYYLTASLTVPASMANWIGLGFAVTNISGNTPTAERYSDANVKGGPWFLAQTAGVSEQFFGGPEASLETDSGNVIAAAGTYNLCIILNTLSSKWTASAYVNGTITGTNVVGGTQLGTNIVYGSNPSIGFVGLTQQALTAATTNTIRWNSLALLTALQPTFTLQPVSSAIGSGASFTFTAAAVADTNGGTVAYQWYSNNVAVSGATKTAFTISSVTASSGGTNYYVVATNTFGAVSSSVASLTVYTNPVFTAALPITYTNPFLLFGGGNVGGTNYLGSTPTFTVSAVGGVPLTYQWYANGTAISHATNTSYTFTNAQLTSASNFTVVASNSYGTVSNTWSASYLPTPTAPYPQAVLAAEPVAFWRLDEQNGNTTGVIIDDYSGGNNGFTTNIVLGQTGYNGAESSEYSAEIGASGSPGVIAQMEGIDFAATSGVNAEFTVEAWAAGYGASAGAPVVTKGVFGSSDAFGLGVDTNATSHYQFYVRSAAGTLYKADSSVSPADENWHHLVGICDEANGVVALYIDGVLAASTNIPAKSGAYEANAPLSIGCGIQNTNLGYTLQFYGFIDDVAVYNYALSQYQIASQYGAVGAVAPVFAQAPPVNVTNNAGSTLVIPATVIGTPPLGYYWTDVSGGTNIASGTGNNFQLDTTLIYPNVSSNWNGDQLELTVTNAYGSTNFFVNLHIVAGAPQIVVDVQKPFYAATGGTASDSVTVSGSLPFGYQWLFDGNGLTDNGHITGSQSNALSIANVQLADAGSYQVVVSNAFGSVTSSVAPLIIINSEPIAFNGNGPGWTTNGGAKLTNNALVLTDPTVPISDSSCFFQYPQYIGAFNASFTYQAGGGKVADGITFCIQNDPRGAAALGGNGGQLGVGVSTSITPSAELEMNLYSLGGETMGYTFLTNGLTGANGGNGNYHTPGSVNFASGNPINVTVQYAGGQLGLSFTDTVAHTSFSTNLIVPNIAAVVGTNTAYVGFTGSYGGSSSVQTVSNYSFVSIPTTAIQTNGPNVVVSWPGAALGYTLQENANLSTTNWVALTNLPTLGGGQNQVTLPMGAGNSFYRLVLP